MVEDTNVLPESAQVPWTQYDIHRNPTLIVHVCAHCSVEGFYG